MGGKLGSRLVESIKYRSNPLNAIDVFRRDMQAFGFQQKPVKPPKTAPPIVKPTGPKEYSVSELGSIRGSIKPSGLIAPMGLGLSGGMDDLQKRTAIATQAVSGGGNIDKNTLQYYRNISLNSMLGKGGIADPTDVEKQFVTNTLGQKIGTGKTGYLSALERALANYGK